MSGLSDADVSRAEAHAAGTGKRDVELAQPLLMVVVDGRLFCPHCHAELSESGAVRIPTFEYAEIKLNDGKIEAEYNLDFEPSRQGAECATCHGALDDRGWSW